MVRIYANDHRAIKSKKGETAAVRGVCCTYLAARTKVYSGSERPASGEQTLEQSAVS